MDGSLVWITWSNDLLQWFVYQEQLSLTWFEDDKPSASVQDQEFRK